MNGIFCLSKTFFGQILKKKIKKVKIFYNNYNILLSTLYIDPGVPYHLKKKRVDFQSKCCQKVISFIKNTLLFGVL